MKHAWLTVFIALIGMALLFAGLTASGYFAFLSEALRALPPPLASVADGPFIYSFNASGVLEEAATSERSGSPYWWLDSGGRLVIEDGAGRTLQGELPARDRWRRAYAASSARDTDDGRYPQTLFRLVTKQSWRDVALETSFRIEADRLLDTENRNESNGLLLMSRYQDGDTLYYAGIRVDGHAVIKKKYRGTYYTLAENAVFQGRYDPASAPNLVPHGSWLHLRSETQTREDGTVAVRLFLRHGEEREWAEVASALDDGSYGGTPPIRAAGRTGIRTDFMDVSFDSFRATPL